VATVSVFPLHPRPARLKRSVNRTSCRFCFVFRLTPNILAEPCHAALKLVRPPPKEDGNLKLFQSDVDVFCRIAAPVERMDGVVLKTPPWFFGRITNIAQDLSRFGHALFQRKSPGGSPTLHRSPILQSESPYCRDCWTFKPPQMRSSEHSDKQRNASGVAWQQKPSFFFRIGRGSGIRPVTPILRTQRAQVPTPPGYAVLNNQCTTTGSPAQQRPEKIGCTNPKCMIEIAFLFSFHPNDVFTKRLRAGQGSRAPLGPKVGRCQFEPRSIDKFEGHPLFRSRPRHAIDGLPGMASRICLGLRGSVWFVRFQS